MCKCRVCKHESCDGCSTTEAGQIEILWNGYLAMTVDVLICEHCSGAWLNVSSGKIFICRACRERALHVRIQTPLQTTIEAARGAA